MKSTLLIILLTLGLGASLWHGKRLSAQAEELRAQLTTIQQAHATALSQTRALEDAVAAKTKAVENLEKAAVTAKAQETAVAQADKASGAESKGTEGGNPMKKLSKSLGKMFESKEGKDMIASQMKMMLQGQYRDIFDELQLDDATRAQVEDLISERLMAGQSVGMRAMAGEKINKAMGEEISKTQAETTKKLEALLGKDKYATFSRYEDSQPERMQITQLKGNLSRNPETALAPDQEEKLMALMYQERKGAKYEVDLADQSKFNPQMLEGKALENYLEQSSRTEATVVEKASAFLRPDQVEALKKQQEQTRNMQQMGVEMLKGMMEGGAEK
jgi:hypothetical protein